MSSHSSSKSQETPSLHGQIARNRGKESVRKCDKLMESFLKKHAREHANKILKSTFLALSDRNSDVQTPKFPPSIDAILFSAVASGQASAEWYETQIQTISTTKEKRRLLKGRSGLSPSSAQSPSTTCCAAKSSRPSAKPSSKEEKVLKSFGSRLYKVHVSGCQNIGDENVDLFKLIIVGDGRCLFRSVAVLLFRSYDIFNFTSCQERELADALRSETVKELRENRELLEQCFVIEGDFLSHIHLMSEPSTFAGEPELFMLSKLISCPICVYVRGQEEGNYKRIQTYGQHFTRKPFRVLFDESRRHYDALVCFTPPNWTPGSF